jgi:hypothetical protein
MIKKLQTIKGIRIKSGRIAMTERGIGYIGLVVEKVSGT